MDQTERTMRASAVIKYLLETEHRVQCVFGSMISYYLSRSSALKCPWMAF